jgi:hypothetical protein
MSGRLDRLAFFKQPVHEREQMVELYWLACILVGTRGHSIQNFIIVLDRCKKHNGRFLKQFMPFQAIAHFDAIHSRHKNIGDDQLRRFFERLNKSFPPVFRSKHNEAVLSEIIGKKLQDIRLIVYDQYFFWSVHDLFSYKVSVAVINKNGAQVKKSLKKRPVVLIPQAL